MSLAGLADAVLADATLASAVADARGGTLRALDLTGPEALRPFLVAGLVRAGRTVLAVTATSREAEDLVAALGDLVDPAQVGYYPSWETLPHERLSPRSDTVGQRLAILRRLRHPGTDANNGPLSVVVAPVRSVLQPQVKGLGDLEPVELVTGDTATRSRTSYAGWPTRRTRESTWWRSAASSRCAAASSTCSRRPRSTPCASSCGATTWRRSARSPWPTSARSTRWSASGRRRAGSCCSPTRYAGGRPSWAGSTRSCSS